MHTHVLWSAGHVVAVVDGVDNLSRGPNSVRIFSWHCPAMPCFTRHHWKNCLNVLYCFLESFFFRRNSNQNSQILMKFGSRIPGKLLSSCRRVGRHWLWNWHPNLPQRREKLRNLMAKYGEVQRFSRFLKHTMVIINDHQ